MLSFVGSSASIRDPWYTGRFDETYADVERGCDELLYYLLHVVFAWWVHKGMVYDILQQFLWLGVVSVVSLVTVALTDLFWVRMGLLAALLGVCALWALRHRDQVARTLAVFRRKSA